MYFCKIMDLCMKKFCFACGMAIALLFIAAPLIAQNNGGSNKILKPAEIYSPVGSKPVEKVEKKETTEKDLAFKYYYNLEFDKAAVLFESVYKESNTYSDYRFLFYSLVASGQYEKAEKTVKQRVKEDKGDDTRYFVDYGYVYNSAGDPKKGNDYYEKALDDMKADNNSIRLVANAFLGVRDKTFAIKTFLRGRKLLKDNKLFASDLGYIYYSIQDYPNMVKEYLNYAETDPSKLNYVYGRFQDYMSKDPEGLVTDALKNELMSRAQTEKTGTYYGEMALWFLIQVKDFDLAYRQAVAIDKRGNNNGETVMSLANICYSNNDFTSARKCYDYVLENYKNSYLEQEAKIGLLSMEYELVCAEKKPEPQQITKVDNMFRDVFSETGMTAEVYTLVISYAELNAYYMCDCDNAVKLLTDLLDSGRLRVKETAQIKSSLADIYLACGDQWEATLLYSQVEKTLKDDPIGFEAKFKNAKLYYYIGEFNWAQSKLDILKTSTGKLIANDAMRLSLFIKDNKDDDSVSQALTYFSKAELADFRKEKDVAFLYLDSASNVNAWSPIEDDVLYKKAELFVSMKQYDKADEQLALIEEKYPNEIVADEALYLRAKINGDNLGKPEVAQECYKKLFMDYPSSIFAVAARNKFREMRDGSTNANTEATLTDEILYAPIKN